MCSSSPIDICMHVQKHLMTPITRICVVVLLVLSFFSMSAEKPYPLVAAVIDLPPYGCTTVSPVCYHNRFFTELAQELGRPITQLTLPYARAIYAEKSGQLDLILIGKNSVLDKTSVAIGTLYCLEFSLVSRLNIRSIEELRKLRIGVIRGSKHTVEKMVGVDLPEAYEVDNYNSAYGMLQKDRLDAYFTPTHSANLLPTRINAYRGTDFGENGWRIEVVLYCRSEICSTPYRSRLEQEMNDLRYQFIMD